MYQKHYEVTIVRTKHRIFLHQGARAAALKEALAKVPDAAEIDEVSTPEDGPAFIEFHEEKRAE
jgi:hypothetical protein